MVVMTQLKKAMNGDVQAAEFLRDLVGEKPLNRDEVANTLPVKTKVSMIVHVLDDADDSDDADTDVISRIANKLLLDRR